ncbi:Midasin [Gossypium arboreum]|uniref:Midasin n=1 Tax=Gossypium arboreum TaxID=29729 RepID=A0A0B0NC12_GOSAR|nr:Midasin [Gossypium arboreum]
MRIQYAKTKFVSPKIMETLFPEKRRRDKKKKVVILWYLRFSAKRDFAVFTTVREAEIINDNSTKQIPFTGLILAGGLLTMLILWLRQTNQLKLTMLDAIMKSIQSAQFRLPIVRKQKVAVTILSSVATTSAGGYL